MKITWLGHAAFMVESEVVVLFDPWITANPTNPFKSVEEIQQVDIVCVTHDHEDHGFNDAATICKQHDACFIGVHELAIEAEKGGVKCAIGGNIGGTVVTPTNIPITFTQAFHSCERGMPCGFIVHLSEGPIYFPGDTAVFGDMALLAKLYLPKVVLIPIGSTYTMGPREAAEAIRMLYPKIAIPCHFNTFPAIEQDAEEFKKLVGEAAEVRILKPGETVSI
ncbi:MAG: metal-dependent hydrolase [Candidatus Heimdallarchaeota archaeon]